MGKFTKYFESSPRQNMNYDGLLLLIQLSIFMMRKKKERPTKKQAALYITY